MPDELTELIALFEERAAVAEASAARWHELKGQWARSANVVAGHAGEARAWRSAAAYARARLEK